MTLTIEYTNGQSEIINVVAFEVNVPNQAFSITKEGKPSYGIPFENVIKISAE